MRPNDLSIERSLRLIAGPGVTARRAYGGNWPIVIRLDPPLTGLIPHRPSYPMSGISASGLLCGGGYHTK